MEYLPSDLLNYVICPHLENVEFINLLDCYKYKNSIKVCLNDFIEFSKIKKSYRRLVNKLIIDTEKEYNSFIKHLDRYKKVTFLKFGDYFNYPVVLPNFIRNVRFGYAFNKPITIPDNVVKLRFGTLFDQPIIIRYIKT